VRLIANPAPVRASRGLFTDAEYDDVQAFFESRPDLQPTPLLRLPSLASEAGLSDIYVKDESQRFGLSAFKIAGVAYAVARLPSHRATLMCATEGNHGRAVARVARERGLRAIVYMRRSAAAARVDAIAGEGARVILVDGTYDDAVRRMAADASRSSDATIVSDTAWPGYEDIPRAIMAGYTWIMTEASRQWADAPDVVVVQAGVGGLAGAVASWLARYRPESYLICAEPTAAACVAASIAAGRPALLTPGDTVMAGLRCGEVSSIALPVLAERVAACVMVDDEIVMRLVDRLARGVVSESPISSGPAGACGLCALLWWMADGACFASRREAAVAPGSRALVINTEGHD
jgi:diaminopropionate ammonia-lyase